MSRQDITNIYKTTIASRAQTIALLNEVTNSRPNIERFNNAYSEWFIMSDKIEDWKDRWSWPWNQSSNIKKVESYSNLVINRAYPPPFKCKLLSRHYTSHVFLGDFLRVLGDSRTEEAKNISAENVETFKMKIEHLLYKANEQTVKYSNDKMYGIHSRTFSPLLLIPAQDAIKTSCGWNIEIKHAALPKDTSRIAARYVVNDFIIAFLLVCFEKIKDIMPIKDVFKYGTVLNLLEAMDAARSQRSKKRVGTQTIEGIKFENDKFLMYEPPDWSHSRKYFGAPGRTSLLDGSVQPGATWCTASTSTTHFTEYTQDYGNHLYYFIDKTSPAAAENQNQLYAVRTIGGKQDDWKIYKSLRASVNYDAHNQRPEILTLRKKIAEDEADASLVSVWQQLCDQNFGMYMEAATIEIRDQKNKFMHHWPRCVTANFNEDWFRKNIVFIDGVNQSKK